MRLFLSGVAALSLGLVSSAGFAREADLLDFSVAAPPAEEASAASGSGVSLVGLGSNPFQDNGSVRGSVSDTMRASFIQQGMTEGVGAVPQRSVPDVSVPRWSGGRSVSNFASRGFAGGFTVGGGVGSFSRCEPTRYVPTWWLPREVEGRRSIYYDVMAAVACEAGIPTSLLDAVIAQESGYKYWIVSPAGAMGMMQIMPGTAKLLGLAVPFDALSNMRAGARYLRQMLDRFGRVDLALAAYNAGPERRSLKAGMIPAIPETLNYVAAITANWSRLAPARVEVATIDRGAIAAAVVRDAGYRSVELSRYDGLNAPKPI